MSLYPVSTAHLADVSAPNRSEPENPVWHSELLVALSLAVALLVGACGSAKPAAPVAIATGRPSPSPTATSTAPSATCSQLLAANPSVDPTTLPRKWSIYKNGAGVTTMVPSGWTVVTGDSIVSVSDPALAQSNLLSLDAYPHSGTAPDVNTIAVAEADSVRRTNADLLGRPDATTKSLPSGPAARLTYCLLRKAADGSEQTLAILQYLIPRQTTPDSYTIYVLQELAPVEKMGYYGPILEIAANGLKLP